MDVRDIEVTFGRRSWSYSEIKGKIYFLVYYSPTYKKKYLQHFFQSLYVKTFQSQNKGLIENNNGLSKWYF